MIRAACLLLAFIATAAFAAPVFAADVTFTGRMEQGGLVMGAAPPGATVTFNDTKVPVMADGHFLLGIGRDAPAAAKLTVTVLGTAPETQTLSIAKRTWQIERVNGVPQQLVTPDPVLLAQIAAENKLMYAAYMKLELTPFFETGFIRPAEGRVSGVFGSQRILNGTAMAPHSGYDIAAPIGTPIHAAADGVVSLRHENMVLTGNTIVLNHGFGLETIYIHMSEILVADGQHVKQGDVIGKIGMTGRATGPHLHFGATWFNTRLDPETLLAVLPAKNGSRIAVDILTDGTIMFDGQPIAMEQLEEKLNELKQQEPPPSFSIQLSKGAKYDAVAPVLAIMQKVGGLSVGFVGKNAVP